MAALTRLAIVTPSALKFEGDAELVVAPGAAGDLGALANHAPLLTTLRTGVVSANVMSGMDGAEQNASKSAGQQRVQFAVAGGFMQVLSDRVTILTDLALSRDEIDVEAASFVVHRVVFDFSQAYTTGAVTFDSTRAIDSLADMIYRYLFKPRTGA